MEPPRQTRFTAMRDATRADYQVIARHSLDFFTGLPDRLLTHLRILAGDTGGYAVDRLTHSLQTATRAQRDGRDDEYVVCALLHDIGDTLAPSNHAQLAATILEPFVSDKNRWIVEQHGIFQGFSNCKNFWQNQVCRSAPQLTYKIPHIVIIVGNFRPKLVRMTFVTVFRCNFVNNF